MQIRFKPWTPAIIYGILAAGLIGIFLAWRLVPKQASSIVIIGLDGKISGEYRIRDPGDVLRYRIADDVVQVFWQKRIDIFPITNVRNLEILQ